MNNVINVRWLRANRDLVAAVVAAMLVVALLAFLVIRQQEPGNQVYVEAGGRTGARTVVPPVFVPPNPAEVPAAGAAPAQQSAPPEKDQSVASDNGERSGQQALNHNAGRSNDTAQAAGGMPSQQPNDRAHQVQHRHPHAAQQPDHTDFHAHPVQPSLPDSKPRQPIPPRNDDQSGQPGRSPNGDQPSEDTQVKQPGTDKKIDKPVKDKAADKPAKDKQPDEASQAEQAGEVPKDRAGQAGEDGHAGQPGMHQHSGQTGNPAQQDKDKQSGKDKTKQPARPMQANDGGLPRNDN